MVDQSWYYGTMKLFVWDFHGVLEKGNEKVVIVISNKVLKEAGYKERLTDKDNEEFYGLKWYQYFEKLIPGLSKKECLQLQSDCYKYSEAHLDLLAKYIKPNDHAVDVLSAISKSNNYQMVISNSRQSDIIWFLNTIGVKRFFQDDDVIGVNAHQTHSNKREALISYLKNKQYDEIVVIGDSEDDMVMGRTVKAINYYYKRPNRSHDDTENADFVIKDLRKVLESV